MALTACEDEVTLREWAPLNDLFQILPGKTQHGLFYTDLKLTCVDVITEYIALGTNSGVVYCYDRKRKDLQRMRCENANSPITVVKIISTVDFMLACGNKDGNINIFQIPKIPPDNLPASLRPKNKQVERYTVSEMHKGTISSLEWSKNGMKLFSGDTNGIVVLTEIDFYMHLCKSVEILNETYEVVQLSYHQQNLLISTTYRSIICQKLEKWKVCQVGKKDRKVLGKFGGIFYQNGIGPTDVVLYCSRPGLRIWVSDMKGSVQQTLLFKDILNGAIPEVPILNPLSTNLKRLKPNKEASFGTVHAFCDEFLVTHNNDVVYVLNPKDLKIVASVSHLRGVLSVSINKDEIFVLEGERSLIRIGFTPEMFCENGTHLSPNKFHPIKSSIKEISNKIQSSNVISAIPAPIDAESHATTSAVPNGEEAREMSPNKFQPLDQTYTEKVYEAYRRLEVYNRIAEEEFDDTILFKHGKRKKSDMAGSVCSASSNSSDEKDASVTKSTVMNVSTIGILPDLRSPDSIQNDIKHKEKMLADLLNFDHLKIDLNQLECDGDAKKKREVVADEKVFKAADNIIQTKTKEVVGKLPNKTAARIGNGIVGNNAIATHTKKNNVPACKALPETWNVFKVNLNDDREESENLSLTDWEII